MHVMKVKNNRNKSFATYFIILMVVFKYSTTEREKQRNKHILENNVL